MSESKARPGCLLEEESADMSNPAAPARPHRRLVRIHSEPGDQRFEVSRGQPLSRKDQLRIAAENRNRLQVRQRIVRKGAPGAVQDVGAYVSQTHRVAI